MDVEERVDAGVGAADGAGVDTEDAARTRKAMAKMVLLKNVLLTLAALLGRAGPAVPVEPTVCLTSILVPVPMECQTVPTAPRAKLKVEPRTLPRVSKKMPPTLRAVLVLPRKRSLGEVGGRLLVALGATTAGVGPARPHSAPSPSAVGSLASPRIPGSRAGRTSRSARSC